MSSNTHSGMRYKPTLELLQKVVDIFMPQQKLSESFDIYLNRINEARVIEGITFIFPEIELIYFPSKINIMLGTKNKKSYKPSGRTSPSKDSISSVIFTFETCILILRQFLRSHEYIVKTKSLKRKDTVNRIMTIIPPSHMIPTENIILTNSDEDMSDSETESDTGSE
jgi:hypothetical protein